MYVLCMTRCIQVDRIKILVIFPHGIHKQKEDCLSVAQTLTSRYQSLIDDLNDLEELGGTKLFLKNQYNTDIFSCCLLLLLFFHLSSDQ